MAALRARAEKFGYTVSTSRPAPAGQQKTPLWQWGVAALIAGGLVGLFALLQRSGLMNVIGTASAGASYGVALLVGVVASLSTCLAVVGAIVIAFAETYQAAPGESAASAVVRPNILFHVGRIATFAVLGGVLGLIGGELSLSGRFVSVLTMVVAVFMLLLGLNILGIAPSLTRLGIKMPARLTVRPRPDENVSQSCHAARARGSHVLPPMRVHAEHADHGARLGQHRPRRTHHGPVCRRDPAGAVHGRHHGFVDAPAQGRHRSRRLPASW